VIVTRATLIERPPDRRVLLRGATDFRDLGGYLTQNGAMVRWRQVFRSASLAGLTTGDIQRLVGELQIRSVIDLRAADWSVVDAVGRIADEPRPIVFHDETGRDRAALVAAVLLGVLGVAEDDIVRDHALSPMSGGPSVMRTVLAGFKRDHGSALGYALDHGLEIATVESLRDALLV
jgi:protein tyrosine/serine phosphatase